VAEKIKLGVLGMGGRGMHFGVKEFCDADPRVQIAAICDMVPEKLADARSRYGQYLTAAKDYTSLEQMLTDEDLAAVINCTGDPLHYRTSLPIIDSGKGLYLEKPMCQTLDDCDNLIRAWQERPNVFLIGLELRYCTLFQDMRKIIDRGEIGRIVLGIVVDNVSVGGHYYFHRRKRRASYVKSLMLEKGTHSLDLANWFIGGHPRRVFCSAGLDFFGGKKPNDLLCRDCSEKDTCDYYVESSGFRMDYGVVLKYFPDACVFAREIDIHDNSIIVTDYDNGARLTYVECHFTPEYTREFTFIGTEGKMVAFYNNEQDFRITVQNRRTKEVQTYYPAKHKGGHGGGDYLIVKQFLDLLEAGRPACVGIEGARDSAAIAIAALESTRTGDPVSIPRVAPVETDGPAARWPEG